MDPQYLIHQRFNADFSNIKSFIGRNSVNPGNDHAELQKIVLEKQKEIKEAFGNKPENDQKRLFTIFHQNFEDLDLSNKSSIKDIHQSLVGLFEKTLRLEVAQLEEFPSIVFGNFGEVLDSNYSETTDEVSEVDLKELNQLLKYRVLENKSQQFQNKTNLVLNTCYSIGTPPSDYNGDFLDYLEDIDKIITSEQMKLIIKILESNYPLEKVDKTALENLIMSAGKLQSVLTVAKSDQQNLDQDIAISLATISEIPEKDKVLLHCFKKSLQNLSFEKPADKKKLLKNGVCFPGEGVFLLGTHPEEGKLTSQNNRLLRNYFKEMIKIHEKISDASMEESKFNMGASELLKMAGGTMIAVAAYIMDREKRTEYTYDVINELLNIYEQLIMSIPHNTNDETHKNEFTYFKKSCEIVLQEVTHKIEKGGTPRKASQPNRLNDFRHATQHLSSIASLALNKPSKKTTINQKSGGYTFLAKECININGNIEELNFYTTTNKELVMVHTGDGDGGGLNSSIGSSFKRYNPFSNTKYETIDSKYSVYGSHMSDRIIEYKKLLDKVITDHEAINENSNIVLFGFGKYSAPMQSMAINTVLSDKMSNRKFTVIGIGTWDWFEGAEENTALQSLDDNVKERLFFLDVTSPTDNTTGQPDLATAGFLNLAWLGSNKPARKLSSQSHIEFATSLPTFPQKSRGLELTSPHYLHSYNIGQGFSMDNDIHIANRMGSLARIYNLLDNLQSKEAQKTLTEEIQGIYQSEKVLPSKKKRE